MIAFRLPVEALEQVEEAAKRRAVSVNELAREALMSTLDEGNEVHRMALRMTTIESELSELRRDLAVATQAVLITAGKFSPARNSAKGRVLTLPIKRSSLSNSYLELAREDYYMGGGDPPGQWHGRGAGVLGPHLEGRDRHLRAVLSYRERRSAGRWKRGPTHGVGSHFQRSEERLGCPISKPL